MGRFVLLDAGVLIRYGLEDDPKHLLIKRAIARLNELGDVLCFTPQALREARSVLTRPASVNGYGLDVRQAADFSAIIRQTFVLLDDLPGVFQTWERLVDAYGVSGKNVHDANLVASAVFHGATHLLTLNERDFRRYTEIELIEIA